MNVIPFVHEGLGNSSYLVPLSDSEAIVVDPDRTAQRYLRAAEERRLRIIATFETHVHADFITGAVELAAADAQVFHSHEAEIGYPHTALAPGERVRLAGAEFEVIASPGHSPEHVSYVLHTVGAPPLLFSGGALTAGGAARTDLVSPDMTVPLTRAAFHTLHKAFAALPGETILYPTHGGGSFCSSGTTAERTSTLSRERERNALLLHHDEEEFVSWFPTTFPAIPAYFSRMRAANRAGPRLRREIATPDPLAPKAFSEAAKGALIIDVRPVQEYARGHIPGSLSNAFRPSYATWLGWLAPEGARLLFVSDGIPIDEVVDESLLVGYEEFGGYLEGGVDAWRDSGLVVAKAPGIDALTVRQAATNSVALLDVREVDEYRSGHIEGAINVPLGNLQANLELVPRDRPVVAYCGIGERSASATSILERVGFADVRNLEGGIRAWRRKGMPVRCEGAAISRDIPFQ